MDMFKKLYDEIMVSRAIGVRRRFIARWRASHAEPEHWSVRKGRVGLTDEGVKAVSAYLNIPEPAGYAGLDLEDVENVFSMAVVQCRGAGNWIPCRKLNDDEIVNVFVRDAGMFVVGDEFDAKLCSDIYAFEGSRVWPRGLW